MREDQYALEAQLAESHWWWAARRRIISKIMDHYLKRDGGYRLLEVGCGTGSNFPTLREYGDVHGIEMSPLAVEFCREAFPEIDVVQGAIPMKLDRDFDVICLFDVLEHIEDDRMAVEWVYEHVVPGGLVFFSVPAYRFLWSEHDEVSHHFRRYTKTTLVERLNDCFAVRYSTYFNTHLFSAVAGVRLMKRLVGPSRGGSEVRIASRGIANEVLKIVFAAERFWLPTMSLPFGVSIFAVGQKA